jgi:hypothetical protein
MSPDQLLTDDLTVLFLQKEGRLPIENDEVGLGFLKKSFKRLRRSTKNIIRNPGRAIKKRVKRIAKVVKKVAPYAAGAAALYFGAPYALAGAKFLGAKAAGMVSMFGSKIMGGPAQDGGTFLTDGQMGPPLPPGGISSMISPEVLSFAGSLAKQQLMRRGINMKSPRAQETVQRYVNAEAYRAENAVTSSTGFDIKKWLIPAAVGAGVFMMVKV